MIPIKYTLTGANNRELSVDGMTHALNAIGHEHHEIHEGNHYFVCSYGTYAADEDVDFQITTPASNKLVHMTFFFQTTGATTLKVYEGATVAADGASVTAYNSNRNSSNTSDLTIQTDGTVNAAGTLIYSQAWGYTNIPSRPAGGLSERANELILKADTTYRFFVESDSAANIISYCGEWYEHTNKE